MIKTEFINSLKEFFAFTLFLTAIISSQNFFFQNIIENEISKRDIVAQKTLTVVDVQRTEQHKKEVAQKVDPILAPAEDDFIKTNLQTLQSSIIQIRKKNAMPTVKKEEISILFDLSDNSRKDFIIEFLLNADDSSLHEVFDKATVTLNNILQVGITEKDYEKDNIDKIIMGNMVTNVSRRQVSIIKAMLEQVIVPNLVVDDFATEIARKNVQNSVKPYETVFQKGDKILFEGEPVTRLKRDALRQAGYNIYELNTQGLACVYVLVFISTLLFLVYMKFFEKTLLEKNHLVIFSVLAITTAAIAAIVPGGTSPYVLPIPALIIIVSIFSNPRIAFVMATMLLALLTVGFQYDIPFMAAFIMMSLFGVISMSRIQYAKRVDLLKAGVHISLVGIMLI